MKDLGDVMQSARPDPVRALLVFLHLLKCNPKRVAEFRLTHIEHQAANADAAADMLVDGVRGFRSWHWVGIAIPYDITPQPGRARNRMNQSHGTGSATRMSRPGG